MQKQFLDNQLLIRLKSGDSKAVTQWFHAYHDKLLAFILKKVDSQSDAEELVQETFINCLKHLPLFRGQSSIFTWMCGIASHEVADFYRKKYAKKALKLLPLGEWLGTELGGGGLSSQMGAQSASELSIADAHEVSLQVRRVLKKLSPRAQELLQLKYVDRRSVVQIAQEFGRSVKAVESELFRARREFKLLWGVDGG